MGRRWTRWKRVLPRNDDAERARERGRRGRDTSAREREREREGRTERCESTRDTHTLVPDYDFKRVSCPTAPGLVSQCKCAVAEELRAALVQWWVDGDLVGRGGGGRWQWSCGTGN